MFNETPDCFVCRSRPDRRSGPRYDQNRRQPDPGSGQGQVAQEFQERQQGRQSEQGGPKRFEDLQLTFPAFEDRPARDRSPVAPGGFRLHADELHLTRDPAP